MSKLDKVRADRLSITPKVIKQDIMWQTTTRGYKLRVRVIAPEEREVLELWGVVGRTNRSFTLLYKRLPIRRYCAQGYHKSPDGLKVNGHHKHTWDEIHEDAFVYVPDDIDEHGDVNTQFAQFLKEQNIQCEGIYQHIFLG